MSKKRTLDSTLVNNKAYEFSPNSPYDQINEVAPQTDAGAYNDPSKDGGHYAHTYFVLENSAETQKDFVDPTVNINEDDVYNKLNSKVGHQTNFDGTYDTAETASKGVKDQRTEAVGDGSNNTIGDNDEDNYNHINGSIMRNGTTDNVYGIPDDIVNDYGDATSGIRNEQDVDNTYNHIKLDHQ